MSDFKTINRDKSWLSFNHRVLQEAKDPSVPLFERIKFLAIYSSNLDEFFRVRVAFLRSFKELKKETRKKLSVKPKKELKGIRKIVQQQQNEFGQIFREEIIPELQKNGIFITNNENYSPTQKEFARKYFFEKIYSNLFHTTVSADIEVPFLENKDIHFVVQLADCDDFALVDIPSDELPRFVVLPSDDDRHHITFLDDIIRDNLSELLDREIAGAYAVKISRDAEMYIDDEYEGDLLEKIKAGLKERNVGLPTRFLYDNNMPEDFLKMLRKRFKLSKNDLIPGARYHNFNDFFGFPDPTNLEHLHNPELPPLPHPELEAASSQLDAIREKDYLLHFPYQKYDYVPQLIWEAAEDEAVKDIKMTLYRVASKSAVVQGLLKALENGKKVTTFIEAKARFDEASNLYWGERLQEAGANVFYSYPGIKVHTKLLFISREEAGEFKNYAYLGTGNFNEKTAKLYCDHALLTTDKKMTNDVSQVFDLLEKKIIITKTKRLFVSPFTTRSRFEALINNEIQNAEAGKEAYMILKMNSLEDTGMIHKLYEASQAGVQIKLIVRGICCLIPGVEGMSENISVISIVDRFLEHARVYIFANGGKELMYTASADWMTRNLDRRVEVVIPITAPDVYEELRAIINIQLNDNVKARIIDETQSNPYRTDDKVESIRAQVAIYNYLKEKVSANYAES
jgi:polyphosphate kinase